MPSLTIQQAYDLALVHHRAGQLAEAESIYRKILGIAPNHAPTLSMLGMLARQQGRLTESLELTGRAVELDPGSPLSHFNQAQSLAAAGMIDQAIASYRNVVVLQPDQFEAHNNLGNQLRTSGALREAADSLRRAVALRPDLAQAHFNLANTLADIGQTNEAAIAFARTIDLQPDHAEAHLILGNIDILAGRLREAADNYRRAVRAAGLFRGALESGIDPSAGRRLFSRLARV